MVSHGEEEALKGAEGEVLVVAEGVPSAETTLISFQLEVNCRWTKGSVLIKAMERVRCHSIRDLGIALSSFQTTKDSKPAIGAILATDLHEEEEGEGEEEEEMRVADQAKDLKQATGAIHTTDSHGEAGGEEETRGVDQEREEADLKVKDLATQIWHR